MRILSLLAAALAMPALIARAEPAAAARELIDRVLPGQAGSFVCEVIPQDAGKDVFEIEARDGKIVLRGNHGVAIATAFNWYLRQHCLVNYDWQAAGPLRLPAAPPLPAAKLRQTCAAPERFALNYCTYGFTSPFWQWDQWQRMANLDSWGGPLPLSYIDGQRKLQTQILARARGLGMRPILAAFAGHVPKQLKAVQPEARIARIKPGWGGMAGRYATWFLDPSDPLFIDIQHRFLKEQAAMYGTDHLYSADPFNEIAPPSWEPDYLAGVSKTIYQSMAGGDPDAVWYLMSWNFFFDQDWTPPRLKALTLAVPKGKMIYLDYVCEQEEFFRKTDNFHGAPFIWCFVGNFGGTTSFAAPLGIVADRSSAALPVSNCLGKILSRSLVAASVALSAPSAQAIRSAGDSSCSTRRKRRPNAGHLPVRSRVRNTARMERTAIS